MSPDNDEERIIIQLKVHLGEMESDYDGVGSLAAAVAEAWSMFLNDVSAPAPRMYLTSAEKIGVGMGNRTKDGIHP
jgi:hypothetical protein